MKKYTVILIYPDHIAETYGGEFYWGRVEAHDPEEALARARRDVLAANGIASIEDDPDGCDPRDFACIACIGGWVDNENPEE